MFPAGNAQNRGRLRPIKGSVFSYQATLHFLSFPCANRLAELLAEKVPSAKVIKLYELDKSTVRTSSSNAESLRIAKLIREMKADLLIASQAD